MQEEAFSKFLREHTTTVRDIEREAVRLHASVGQTYGKGLPYGYHLCAVARVAMQYAASVVADEDNILPVVFGAYFHDSIEDARLTYNDVIAHAGRYMDSRQAVVAAEIVYALTNEKGRTRAERADERYYSGIRATPYAPLVKLCDRYANISYSHMSGQQHFIKVYTDEWTHFLKSITSESSDLSLSLPDGLVRATEDIIKAEK